MKTKVILLILAAAGVAGLGVIALCAGGMYMLFQNTTADVSPRVDELMNGLLVGDVAQSYQNDTTAQFKAATSREQYQQMAEVLRGKLGPVKSKSMRGVQLRSINGRSYADLTYQMQFEKGPGTLKTKLEKDGGVWKFVSFNVESPVLTAAMAQARCPKCGAAHALMAKFCPQCGEPLKSSDK